MKLTPKMIAALADADANRGTLRYSVAGYTMGLAGDTFHSFQTINALVRRGLLDRQRPYSLAVITKAGRVWLFTDHSKRRAPSPRGARPRSRVVSPSRSRDRGPSFAASPGGSTAGAEPSSHARSSAGRAPSHQPTEE